MTITYKDIEPLLEQGAVIKGNKKFVVTNVQAVENVNDTTLDWVNPIRKEKISYILNSPAPVIICESGLMDELPVFPDKCLIFVNNPKLTFLRLANHFFVTQIPKEIHPSAVIHPEAEISDNCFIGPNTSIGKCKIGNNSIIHGNCYLYYNVNIGANVTIHAGTVIGADGFGYQRNDDGTFEKFPHIGGVIIENNVEIGANTCIDRGALSDTVIGEGTKINNLCHIAHNVVIGHNVVITALVNISGSTKIGSHAWIGPNATIRGQLNVGNNVVIGMGAVVTKDVPAGETWVGNPAKMMKR